MTTHWGKVLTLINRRDGTTVHIQDWTEALDRYYGIPTDRGNARFGYLKSAWKVKS